jgi:hypothetical protein
MRPSEVFQSVTRQLRELVDTARHLGDVFDGHLRVDGQREDLGCGALGDGQAAGRGQMAIGRLLMDRQLDSGWPR